PQGSDQRSWHQNCKGSEFKTQKFRKHFFTPKHNLGTHLRGPVHRHEENIGDDGGDREARSYRHRGTSRPPADIKRGMYSPVLYGQPISLNTCLLLLSCPAWRFLPSSGLNKRYLSSAIPC